MATGVAAHAAAEGARLSIADVDSAKAQKLADAALHDWSPILFVILWALMPHGELKWSELKWAMTPPALYLVYALGRGAIDGWYPYYFLNPTLQAAGELAVSILGTLAVFAIIAGSAIAFDRRMGRQTHRT